MEESISLKHDGKNIDIKQEKQDNADSFKYEFDSGSQDSSKSGSGGYQRWAPNLNGVRKSAFTPYKSVQCTALTNLQRGNTQARVPELPQPDCSFHAKAGRGEITREDAKLEPYIDITDEHGLTALHWAASYGQLNSCQDITWSGANVNTRGPEGETALHLAAAGGHHEIVKFLLNEGADSDIQDDSGSTALMYAAAADYPYTCHELLVRGADLTLTNDYDQDAYTLATKNNCKLGKEAKSAKSGWVDSAQRFTVRASTEGRLEIVTNGVAIAFLEFQRAWRFCAGDGYLQARFLYWCHNTVRISTTAQTVIENFLIGCLSKM